jgi:CSLREA domain-containing protein
MKNLLPLFILIFAASINAATFTVTRIDDRNAVCVSGVDCSLREAVNAANSSPDNDVINFSAGITRIGVTSQLVVENAGTLTINGLGAQNLAIAATNHVVNLPTFCGHRVFYTNAATVTLTDLKITGGQLYGACGGTGAGIFVNEGTLVLDRVHVTNNQAFLSGGGIFYSGGTNHRITNSTISENSVGRGGGGFVGSPYVANSTIANNSSDGGNRDEEDAAFGGNPVLRNVTIAFNGGRGEDFRPSIGSDMRNTISITNPPPPFCVICQPPCRIVGDNLIGNCNASQFLEPLAFNGGPTPTLALRPNSLAIDAGNNAFAVDPFSNNAFLTDQRGPGFPRIIDGNADGTAIVDIGAFERQMITTAANVSVGGKVTDAFGKAISRTTVTIRNASTGETKTAYTGSFGYYRFENLPVGDFYVVSVSHRRYAFSQNSQIIVLNDAAENVNFKADAQ